MSLPGGIHFRKLAVVWFEGEDLSLTTALVEGCSHTLESLDTTYTPRGTSICIWVRANNVILSLVRLGFPSFNLSKATKLGDVVFQL